MVRRHEVLRTGMDAGPDGTPVGRLTDAMPELPVVDLSGLDADDRPRELERRISELAALPFDLARPPLLRGRLHRLADDEHVLALTAHHVAFDGTSQALLERELASLYVDFAGGRRPRMANLPIQFADFAAWQRRFLADGGADRQLEYWRRELAGAAHLLELPTDRPRPPAIGFRGAAVTVPLGPDLARGLTALARSEGASPFMLSLAGYAALLHRLTGQDDVLVSVPFGLRDRSELEPLIGLLAGNLPVRVRFRRDSSLRDLVRQVRRATLDAYASKDIPFERLVELVNPERSASHLPLAQVFFGFEAAGPGRVSWGAIDSERVATLVDTSTFDLSLLVTRSGGDLAATFGFRTDLWEAPTALRLADRYRRLLAALTADPDRRIARAPLLAPSERRTLEDCNATAGLVPARAVHEMIEDQVGRTPQAVAVLAGDQALSYADLDRRANQLAHRLIQLGAGPEVVVGVLVDRSVDLLVALLGVLKSGAA